MTVSHRGEAIRIEGTDSRQSAAWRCCESCRSAPARSGCNPSTVAPYPHRTSSAMPT
jgi:hypothetical protein